MHTKILLSLSAYIGADASLFEINPCLKTADERIIAVDAKVTLDENALFRHPDLEALRDTDEEDPTEVEAKSYGLNYVNLDGNVGCMVNGAGLAMATINIFGGIVRCDRVAQGIVDAYKNLGNVRVPIIVRLQGTNADIAKELIDNSGLEVHSAIQLQEAADLVKKMIS